MRVVIAGSSGFLGNHLVDRLRVRGHEVVRLVRREAQGPHESRWDPATGSLDPAVVQSADVVVNLAGSPTAGNPHSRRWADELRSSRVDTTRLLAETIAAAPGHKPAFLAGNGISFYGDHGTEPVDERAESRGDALLTDVTKEWEAATHPARDAGSRVCVLRTSPVMDRDAPPLKQLRLLFLTGLGGRIGSGRQHFPMISLRDWVGAVTFLAEHQEASGPVNLCCPDTPTYGEFTHALGDALHRPTFATVPGVVVQVAAGRMAPEVLGSINARPAVLERLGYDFSDQDVRDVLAAGLA